MVLISTKISAKGQITLPQKVRKALAVKPGDRLVFVVEGATVSLRSLGPCRARDLAGSLRQYSREPKDSELIRTEVKQEVGRAAAGEGEGG